MERAVYWWTGLIVTGFFGFFTAWTYGDAGDDLGHTGVFWFSLGGAVVGLVLLLIAAIATGVAVGIKDASKTSAG